MKIEHTVVWTEEFGFRDAYRLDDGEFKTGKRYPTTKPPVMDLGLMMSLERYFLKLRRYDKNCGNHTTRHLVSCLEYLMAEGVRLGELK